MRLLRNASKPTMQPWYQAPHAADGQVSLDNRQQCGRRLRDNTPRHTPHGTSIDTSCAGAVAAKNPFGTVIRMVTQPPASRIAWQSSRVGNL